MTEILPNKPARKFVDSTDMLVPVCEGVDYKDTCDTCGAVDGEACLNVWAKPQYLKMHQSRLND